MVQTVPAPSRALESRARTPLRHAQGYTDAELEMLAEYFSKQK
jgi:hypothetical protein